MVSGYNRCVLATNYMPVAVYEFCTSASFELERSETGGLWMDAGVETMPRQEAFR